jgi:hypothetical protein
VKKPSAGRASLGTAAIARDVSAAALLVLLLFLLLVSWLAEQEFLGLVLVDETLGVLVPLQAPELLLLQALGLAVRPGRSQIAVDLILVLRGSQGTSGWRVASARHDAVPPWSGSGWSAAAGECPGGSPE